MAISFKTGGDYGYSVLASFGVPAGLISTAKLMGVQVNQEKPGTFIIKSDSGKVQYAVTIPPVLISKAMSGKLGPATKEAYKAQLTQALASVKKAAESSQIPPEEAEPSKKLDSVGGPLPKLPSHANPKVAPAKTVWDFPDSTHGSTTQGKGEASPSDTEVVQLPDLEAVSLTKKEKGPLAPEVMLPSGAIASFSDPSDNGLAVDLGGYEKLGATIPGNGNPPYIVCGVFSHAVLAVRAHKSLYSLIFIIPILGSEPQSGSSYVGNTTMSVLLSLGFKAHIGNLPRVVKQGGTSYMKGSYFTLHVHQELGLSLLSNITLVLRGAMGGSLLWSGVGVTLANAEKQGQ